MPKTKPLKALTKRVFKQKKKILKIHGSCRHLLVKKSAKTKKYRKDRKEDLSKVDLKKIKKLI